MKRFLFIAASLLLGIATSCDNGTEGGGNGQTSGVNPVAAIAVTGNADNQATVTASLEEGDFYGGKIVPAVRISELDEDFAYNTSEIQLIQWVEENGKEITEMPYTEHLTNLVYNQSYLSAVIVYDATGRACSSAWTTFIAQGQPDGISEENSAGSLDDNNPML